MTADAKLRDRFIDHVRERQQLTVEQARALEEATRQFRDAVASVAIRHHLIDPARIDELLESEG